MERVRGSTRRTLAGRAAGVRAATRSRRPDKRAAIAVFDAAQIRGYQHAGATYEVDSAPARPSRCCSSAAPDRCAEPALTVATPWTTMPQLGHESRRVGLGVSADDAGARSLALDARLALHDLADPTPAIRALSSSSCLARADPADDEVRDGSGSSSSRLSLVRIVSLSAQNRTIASCHGR